MSTIHGDHSFSSGKVSEQNELILKNTSQKNNRTPNETSIFYMFKLLILLVV